MYLVAPNEIGLLVKSDVAKKQLDEELGSQKPSNVVNEPVSTTEKGTLFGKENEITAGEKFEEKAGDAQV